MIRNRYLYSGESSTTVASFNASVNKQSTYWSTDAARAVAQLAKKHYIAEQQHLCCYCGLPDPSTHGLDWDIEHVVAQKPHPEFMFTSENLAVACKECNTAKGMTESLVDPSVTVYPGSSDDFHLVHPHFDEWSDHILRDHLVYAAWTPKGTWTIRECGLGRFASRSVGMRYPISDERYETDVRRLLKDGVGLQEIVDKLKDIEAAAGTID
jgi:hypothetical protein